MARKPQYKLNPNLERDVAFTDPTNNDLTLAEVAQLSIPPGSPLTVEQLLNNFPLQFVTGQAQAAT